MRKQAGFTLIELLLVIAIIGLIATLAVVGLNRARAKNRDAKRLADIKTLQTALALYLDRNGRYPDGDGNGCGGWDTPQGNSFIPALITDGEMSTPVQDPLTNTNCANYRYYRYPPTYSGCDATKGGYYVLEIIDLETTSGKHPSSPGWLCGTRDWTSEGDWVTGSYENGS